MTSLRTVSRRSFLGRVAGGLVLSGGSLALLSGRANALQQARRVTDSDDGPINDPPNLGRGQRIASCRDVDNGPNSDPGQEGRGSGRTDRDSGRRADPVGCGRR